MPSKPLPISRGVAQLLRDRREALGLTLRRVAELSVEAGNPIPPSTLTRIELGKYDPGVRRLGQLLDLYQLPIQAAGDVLDLEALGPAIPMERDPEKLRDRALDAWKHGRVSEAFAHFLAFRRRVPNDDAHRHMRHEAILAFASAAAGMGKNHLSRQLLDELLLDNPDSKLLVPILIQQSVLWRVQGSLVAAQAFLEMAGAKAKGTTPKLEGWVEHQRAQVLIDQSEFAAASRCLTRAVRLHRLANARYDEARVVLSMARLEFERDDPKAALRIARRAESLGARYKLSRVRLSAIVDQGRAEIALGAYDEAKKLLRGVLAESLVTEDHAVSFYAHFYLWKAEFASNSPRASVELREAAYFLRYVDQNSLEAQSVRREMLVQPNDFGPSPRKSRPKRSGPRLIASDRGDRSGKPRAS